MKKVVIVILIILLCGCNNKVENKVDDVTDKVVNAKEEENKEEEVVVNNNPIKLALYVNKEKVSTYSSPMNQFTDIVSLECFYTDEDRVSNGKFKDVFNSYYGNYSDIDKYKIGYRIRFSTVDGEVDRYIYRPRDVEAYFNYIQTYLYDDIHQDSGWYSHVEEKDYTDNTLLTSVKLTASVDIAKVNSDVSVSVFSYCDDDIVDGKYIGKNEYTVVINKV